MGVRTTVVAPAVPVARRRWAATTDPRVKYTRAHAIAGAPPPHSSSAGGEETREQAGKGFRTKNASAVVGFVVAAAVGSGVRESECAVQCKYGITRAALIFLFRPRAPASYLPPLMSQCWAQVGNRSWTGDPSTLGLVFLKYFHPLCELCSCM